MATNTFGIDYTNKRLHILFNGETHTFDLLNGDTGDFWYTFADKGGKVWDINYFQEDETCEPVVVVYPVNIIGEDEQDYKFEIDTSIEHFLSCIAMTGKAEEYFGTSIVTEALKEGDVIGNRYKVSKVIYPASAQADSEMKAQYTSDIKEKLQAIMSKINDNAMSAWNADLENTIEAVACEDYYGDVEEDEPTVKYNGWYEDLQKLLESL